MTDRMTDRERIEKLEADLAFVVRHIELRENGHATTSEFERFAYLRDSYPRYWSRHADTVNNNTP